MKIFLIVVLCLAHFGGLLLFFIGFFPVKPLKNDRNPILFQDLLSNYSDHEQKCIKNILEEQRPSADFDRVVIIVIDALRQDFILSEKAEVNVPFITELRKNGKAIGLKAKTQAPTVTLPRIKAFTAGIVPAFVDAMLNLDANHMQEDNLLRQFHAAGKRIHFFGDETWLKIFPNDLFAKFEGTTSFFVSDYTEVDINVTRHLDAELSETATWDLLILHYLGVDHIGHLVGPSSPLLPKKLGEMDDVIRRIYSRLIREKPLIVVCGDHGMSDVGSHGGATNQETTVPLLFISPSLEMDSVVEGLEVQQIDLVPTLASLVGLPIPKQNLGVVISSVISAFNNSLEAALGTAWRNAMQIYQLSDLQEHNDESFGWTSDYLLYLRAVCNEEQVDVGNLEKDMLEFSLRTRESLILSLTEYKMNFLLVGTVVLVLEAGGSLFLLKSLRKKSQSLDVITGFGVISVLVHTVSLGSSSFVEEEHQTVYFLWTSLLLVAFFAALRDCFRGRAMKVPTDLILLLILHRLCRNWNQTGVKFSHLPDIGDWLNRPEHWTMKNVIVLLSFGLLLFGDRHKCFVAKLIFLFSSVLALLHQILCNEIFPDASVSLSNNKYWIARVVYVGMVILLLLNASKYALVAFGILNMKMINIPLIPMIIISANALCNLLRSLNANAIQKTLAFYWFSTACFFYLGNSNSLGTIDLSCGYYPLSSYQPSLIAIPVLLNLHYGRLLVWNKFPAVPKLDIVNGMCLILTLRSISVAFYALILLLQRYHLFVWSVFAPKLLYEAVHSTLVIIAILFVALRLSIRGEK